MRVFDEWLKTFRDSINGFRYYINFEKVKENAAKYKDELQILGGLIREKNIEAEFKRIITKFPECLKAVPILLAVREYEMYCQDETTAVNYRFDKTVQTPEQYAYFMQETGLFDIIQNHIEHSLKDYILGVETGMDSNGRKNRGGHQMENLVEEYIRQTGAEYYPQMYLEEIERRWHLDLSRISAGGTSTKKFDFVVKGDKNIYAVETNFYASGGSKLNETARSYKMLAEESRGIEGFVFVWITDGGGWRSARHNLKEAFDAVGNVYNIYELENGILERIMT